MTDPVNPRPSHFNGSAGTGGFVLLAAVIATFWAAQPSFARAANSPSATPAELAIRDSLRLRDGQKLAAQLNAFVEARLPAITGKPDPVLDRLFAESIMNSGNPFAARPFIQRAIDASKGSEAAHYTLLLASAQESLGDFQVAEQGYRFVISDTAAVGSDKRVATLSLANLLVATRPAETISLLSPLRGSGTVDWEAELLASRAYRISGNVAETHVAMERAWTAAPTASAESKALARILSDRAFEAGLMGARDQFNAMEAVIRTDRDVTQNIRALRGNLPVCGSNGVASTDRVVVEIVSDPEPGRPRVSVVWTSRPGIGQPFLDAALRTPGLDPGGGGQVALLTLACVTSPTSDFTTIGKVEEAVTGWLTSQGVYPVVQVNDEDVSGPSAMLASREARYGKESLFLVPTLFDLVGASFADASAMDPAGRKRLAEYEHRIVDILAKSGAPADLRVMSTMTAVSLDALAETVSQAQAQEQFIALMNTASANDTLSLDLLYILVTSAAQAPTFTTSFKTTMLERSLAAFSKRRTDSNDRREQSLALQLIALRQSAGDNAGALALASKFGFAPDLCALSSPSTHFVSADIRTEDYPKDLLRNSLAGSNMTEFDLNAEGFAQRPRIIIADPPFAFDAITMQKATTIRYDPARSGGMPHPCRGQVQNVRWQLPYQ